MKNNSSFIIRLFITGFVLAIVFAFVSPGALGNVSADTPITGNIRINVPRPASGNKPDTDLSHYYVTNEHCSVTSVKWYYMSGDKYVALNGKFTNGNYRAFITVKPEVGYSLPELKYKWEMDTRYYALERGRIPNVNNVVDVIDAGDGAKTVIFAFVPDYAWKSIEINIDEPQVGLSPYEQYYDEETGNGKGLTLVKQDTTNSFKKSFVEQYCIMDDWYESKNGSEYTKMSRSTGFKAGYYYKCQAPVFIEKYLVKNYYKAESWNSTNSTADSSVIYDNLSIIVNGTKFTGQDVTKWADQGMISFGQIKSAVENVKITDLNTPLPGESPDLSAISGESGKYKISVEYWCDYEKYPEIIPMTASDKFEAGKRYMLSIKTEITNDNYEFAKNSNVYYYIDGVKQEEYSQIKDESRKIVYRSFIFKCPDPVISDKTLYVTGISQPVEGNLPTKSGMGTDGNKNYTVKSVKWSWIDESGEAVTMTESETFKAGIKYYADFLLEAKSGYSFPNNEKRRQDYGNIIKCTNGKYADVGYIMSTSSDREKYLTIRAEFTPLELIREIDLGGYVSPAPGVKASYDKIYSNTGMCVVGTDNVSPHKKNGVTWGENKGGSKIPLKYDDEPVFEENKAYYMEVYVKPAEGYAFPKDAEIPNIKVLFSGSTKGDITVEKYDYGYIKITIASFVREQIKSINYNIVEPVAGKAPGIMTVETTPSNALTEDFQSLDTKGLWEKSKDGKVYESMAADEVFEKGYYYRTKAHSTHILTIFLGTILGRAVYDTNNTCGLASNVQILINNKDSNSEGVLEDGYVVFDNLKPEEDPKKEEPKAEDPKSENPDDKDKNTADNDAKDGKNTIPGVGTFSDDGKILTDTSGKKYRVSEKITNAQLKKNAKIADVKSGGKYRITKVIINKKTGKVTGGNVEYMAPYNINCKLISATGIVKLGGVKFKVTSIAANCAKGCKKLNKVIIGSYVSNIGKNAFSGCSKLKTVTFKGSRLKKVGANAFKGINKKATISVPKAKKKAYTKLLKGKGQAKTVKIK